MGKAPLLLSLVGVLLAACSTQVPADGPLLADGDKRECRTGTSICRKPDPNSISEVRTVSGEAARSGTAPQGARPVPGTQ